MKRLFLSLFLFAVVNSAMAQAENKSTPKVAYTYSAQKNFIPEDLGAVFLGMEWEALQRTRKAKANELTGDGSGKRLSYTRSYQYEKTEDYVRSATFVFVSPDGNKARARLFQIRLVLDRELAAFITKYHKGKVDRVLDHNGGYRMLAHTGDGLQWIIDYPNGTVPEVITTGVLTGLDQSLLPK